MSSKHVDIISSSGHVCEGAELWNLLSLVLVDTLFCVSGVTGPSRLAGHLKTDENIEPRRQQILGINISMDQVCSFRKHGKHSICAMCLPSMSEAFLRPCSEEALTAQMACSMQSITAKWRDLGVLKDLLLWI